MPIYKDEKNGRWYAMVRYENWKGQRKQKCKRGFATKREALEWERTFQQQNAGDLDMTFEAFCELYEKDMRPRLKESTWATKDHITRTKLLPYFGERRFCDIDTKDIIVWQNELLAYRDEKKQPYLELPQSDSEYQAFRGAEHHSLSKAGRREGAYQLCPAHQSNCHLDQG